MAWYGKKGRKIIGEVKSGLVVYPAEAGLPTPYYYIELADTGEDTQMVACYKLIDKDIKKYYKTGDYSNLRKPYRVDKVHKPAFKAETALGKVLNSKVKNGEVYMQTSYAPACFVSEVTTNTDTATGKLAQGFKEYVPREVGKVIQDHKQKVVNVPDQEPTGVFIGLSHVHWLKDVITPENLSDYLGYLNSYYFRNDSFDY